MTRIAIIILAILIAIAVAPASARDRYGCSDLADYHHVFEAAISEEDLETLFTMFDQDPATVSPSGHREMARLLDDWADELEAIPQDDVPRVARIYHAAYIDLLRAGSDAAIALATFGMSNALILPYLDAVAQAVDDVEAVERLGEKRCGADWPFDDGPFT